MIQILYLSHKIIYYKIKLYRVEAQTNMIQMEIDIVIQVKFINKDQFIIMHTLSINIYFLLTWI